MGSRQHALAERACARKTGPAPARRQAPSPPPRGSAAESSRRRARSAYRRRTPAAHARFCRRRLDTAAQDHRHADGDDDQRRDVGLARRLDRNLGDEPDRAPRPRSRHGDGQRQGEPAATRDAAIMPPSMMNSPWAKLITPRGVEDDREAERRQRIGRADRRPVRKNCRNCDTAGFRRRRRFERRIAGESSPRSLGAPSLDQLPFAVVDLDHAEGRWLQAQVIRRRHVDHAAGAGEPVVFSISSRTLALSAEPARSTAAFQMENASRAWPPKVETSSPVLAVIERDVFLLDRLLRIVGGAGREPESPRPAIARPRPPRRRVG